MSPLVTNRLWASRPTRPRLDGRSVLLASGAQDPIVPASNSERLGHLLTEAGAAVEHHVLPGGHGLSQMDVALARRWLEREYPAQLAA